MNCLKTIVYAGLCLCSAAFFTAPALAEGDAKNKASEAPKAAQVPEAGQPAQLKEATPEVPLAPETVLVKVEGAPVTQADLDGEISQIRQMMKNRSPNSAQQFEAMLKHVKPQILEGIVVRKLIGAECEREKIKVTPEEIAKEVAGFEATLPQKMKLEDFLKQNGITRENFERDVGEQVKIEKLLKIAPPTDQEIRAYYDDNKKNYEMPETVSARHILVAVDAGDDAAKKEAKKKKAEDLRKKLDKGGDFAKLAEENSDCPSKARGGSLGEFPRGNMVPAFEQATFSMKSNEISGVVETEFGFHIIQNTGHNAARTVPFEDVKGQIAFRLKSRQVQEKLEGLVEKLKSGAKIEFTKEGEGLKLKPRPMNAFPMAPAGEKPPASEAGDKPAGETPAKAADKK